MPEAKLQIIMPTAEDFQKLGIKKELEETKPTVHNEADENYYNAVLGPTLGKAVHTILAGKNRERIKAFENPDIQRFFESFQKFVEKRAHELGYFADDMEISPRSGITKDGYVLIKLIPKQGARRLV